MPVVFFIVLIASGFGGIAVGTSLGLAWQVAIFAGILVWLQSDSVTRLEVGAIVPMTLGVVFIIGMIIGDVSYMIQSDIISDWNLTNPFIVKDLDEIKEII